MSPEDVLCNTLSILSAPGFNPAQLWLLTGSLGTWLGFYPVGRVYTVGRVYAVGRVLQ